MARFDLEDVLRAELRGVGLWLDNANMTPEETVEALLADRLKARLGPQ